MAQLRDHPMRLDPRGARGQTCRRSNARRDEATRMTQREAQLNSSLDDAALGACDGDGFPLTPKRVTGGLLCLAIMVGTLALPAQALAQPQPVPRPRELRQTPAPSAPTLPLNEREEQTPSQPTLEAPEEKSEGQAPSTRSRAQWRALHRACGEEWSRMMKAGQTIGLIWVDFFEACQKRP